MPVSPRDARVGKPGGTFRMAIGEPVAIDPYNSQESEGQLVTKNIFDTLTTVASGKVEKQLAASYSRNATCTQWTFDLKQGQRFSNGEPVDAESIKRGMTRAAIGTATSDAAYHMAGIVGFDALQANKASTFAGVTANGLTLTIKLSAADCEFDLKTSQPVFSPVPPEAGAASNTKYNDMPIGNGPFMMAGPWQHDKSITLVRNPDYTDGPAPLLNKVEMTIYEQQLRLRVHRARTRRLRLRPRDAGQPSVRLRQVLPALAGRLGLHQVPVLGRQLPADQRRATRR